MSIPSWVVFQHPVRAPGTISTREASKLVTYYCKTIRAHDKHELLGVYRLIIGLHAKGFALAQISQAMQNYIADPFVRTQEQRQRHQIRTFMMPEKIKRWATVHVIADPSLAALDKLNHAYIPTLEVDGV